MLFSRNKGDKIRYEIALNDARSATFQERAGERVVIFNFGNYSAFVITPNTKDWIQNAYDLSEDQARSVYRLLASRVRSYLADVASRRSLKERQKRSEFLSRSDFNNYRAGLWH